MTCSSSSVSDLKFFFDGYSEVLEEVSDSSSSVTTSGSLAGSSEKSCNDSSSNFTLQARMKFSM
jgi:hypothetical protein